MYAVVRTGGKQYRIAAGDILDVEKLDGSVGDTVSLDEVLLVANGDTVQIGQPTVEGASVTAKITGQHRRQEGAGLPLSTQETHPCPSRPSSIPDATRDSVGESVADDVSYTGLSVEGRVSHGSQKGRRFQPKQSRQQCAAPGREALWR